MTLDYDTEIEHLFPPALFQDAVLAAALKQVGIPLEAVGNKVLLFTNARTVAALNAASEPIKAAMRQSGIGFVCYGGNESGGKTGFLKTALHEIVQKKAPARKPSASRFSLSSDLSTRGRWGSSTPTRSPALCSRRQPNPSTWRRLLR